eukprot:9486745-Ditylum_brightwellii.AAC.2
MEDGVRIMYGNLKEWRFYLTSLPKRFSNYQCMKIGNYKNSLDFHGVQASPSTLCLLSTESDTDLQSVPSQASDSKESETMSSGSHFSEASFGTPKRRKPTATKEIELKQPFSSMSLEASKTTPTCQHSSSS